MTILSEDDLLTIHERALAECGGGRAGLLHPRLLGAAIGRAQSGWEEAEFYPSLFAKAAALLESLIRNHPFVDGNKRTGLMAASALLELNGWEPVFTLEEAEYLTLGVEARKLRLPAVIAWLEAHSRPRSVSLPLLLPGEGG